MKKKIVLLFLIMVLFNSCIGIGMPVGNHVSSGEQRDTRISVTTNTKVLSPSKEVFPNYFSMSFWRKSDENTSYEFYLAGVRRIENLYQNGFFYFDAFASIYFAIPAIGGNLGFTTGLKSKYVDFYASLRGDGVVFAPILSESSDGFVYYRQIKPALGAVFSFYRFSLALEGSIIKYHKAYNDTSDQDVFKNTYFINLGISYKL